MAILHIAALSQSLGDMKIAGCGLLGLEPPLTGICQWRRLEPRHRLSLNSKKLRINARSLSTYQGVLRLRLYLHGPFGGVSAVRRTKCP